MNCSRDEAINLLNAWSIDRLDVEAVLSSADFEGSLVGRLILLCNNSVGVMEYHNDTEPAPPGVAVLNFLLERVANFEYADPREAPPEARAEVEASVTAALGCCFSSGARIDLFPRRASR